MLAFTVFAAMSSILIVPPLLVEIATDFEVSVAVAGQLATATFAVWALMGMSGGPLSDSFGRRPVAMVCLAVLSASVLASAFAPNLETLLVLRVLTGLGGGALPATIVGSVSDVIAPARRAQAVSVLLAMQGLASATSIPLVAVLADVQSWRFAFIVYGLMLAVALVANWFWLPKDDRERVRGWVFFSRYRALLSLRFFRVAVTLNLTQRIAFWGMVSFFAAYLIDTFDLSVGFVALPLATTAVGQMIGTYSGGFVANRRSRAVFIAVSPVLGGVCGLAVFTMDLGLWTTVVVASIGMGLLNITWPVLVSASTEYSGDSKATGVGLMSFSNQGAGALGAGIAGALLASLGYAGIGYMCLAATVVGALMTTLLGRQFGETAGQSKG